MLPEMAKRISGSGDLFNKRGRKPWSTVSRAILSAASMASKAADYLRAFSEDKQDQAA
jgi:antirestriction protein ArdC